MALLGCGELDQTLVGHLAIPGLDDPLEQLKVLVVYDPLPETRTGQEMSRSWVLLSVSDSSIAFFALVRLK